MKPAPRRDLTLALGTLALLLAATASLDRVYLWGWRPATWAAIALAVTVAASSRRAGLGGLAALVASAAGWAVFTSIAHLDADGFLFGRAQLHQYLELLSQGVTDVAQEPSPARPLPGLLAITTASAWWVSHSAHELLVRARRPGLAIATAASLWTVPMAVPQPPGRTWPVALPFLAAAGLVLLLEPDPRLTLWRRPDDYQPRPSSAGLGLLGATLALAMLAPAALPGFGAAPWVELTAPSTTRGYQPIVDVSRRLRLPAPRELMRVQAPRPLYLRLAGLDTFDGATWRLGPPDRPSFSPTEVLPAARPLPTEAVIGEAERVKVAVQNVSLENVFVPAPYHPRIVEGAAASRMVYSQDGTFLATSDLLDGEPALVPGLSYVVQADVPSPTVAQLRAVGAAVYQDPRYADWLQLPGRYPRMREIADQVVAGAGSPYDAAVALQEFFRGRFRYSTDVAPLRSAHALTEFVSSRRVGYCEYFATAMAVMLRLEGIPARVAVGFRLGEELTTGEYLVTTDDAHAWVEALFPGYGWIQFEPTPVADALVPDETDATPDRPVGQGAGANPASGSPDGTDEEALQELRAERGQREGRLDEPTTPTASDVNRQSAGRRYLPAIVATVAAVGAAAWALAWRRRSRPEPDDVERILAMQRWLLRTARSYGVGRTAAETVAEVAGRWSVEGRVAPAEAARLAELAQAAAFGGHLQSGAGAEAEVLGHRVLADLRASVGRTARVTAPVRGPAEAVTEGGRRAAVAVLERVRR